MEMCTTRHLDNALPIALQLEVWTKDVKRQSWQKTYKRNHKGQDGCNQ